ncbi:hypothetical protein [Flavitalea sp.]|nr:hypothetical protein [Flavitalea sp.]
MTGKTRNITEFVTDQDYYQYIFEVTGEKWDFAEASNRRYFGVVEEGDYYQLMPEWRSGPGNFFDWYCENRPEDQFFVLKSDAVLRFVQYWVKWTALKKDVK